MKTEDLGEAQTAHVSEGMRLIFDRKSPISSHSSSSNSGDSTYSSRRSSCLYGSRGPSNSRRRRPRHRSRSSSSDRDSSSSDRHSHIRSRSRPRCHRASDRYHRYSRSPTRRYRERSRSYSSSLDRSSRHGKRRGYRSHSRSTSRSSSRKCCARRYRRSRSRSYTRTSYVGHYRCRFSPSPRRYRDYRNRSRSAERSAVQLSLEERQKLLNIAKKNAARMLGVQHLELPASVHSLEEKNLEKHSASRSEERVRADSVPQKKPTQDMNVENEDEKTIPRMSPTRKPITFSINNTVAKPSASPTFHVTESKVTSRADSVGNRKPYGQWVPIKKASLNKH